MNRAKRETKLPEKLRNGEFVVENPGENSSDISENQRGAAVEVMPTPPEATVDLAQGEETPAINNERDNISSVNGTSNPTNSESSNSVNETNNEREDSLIERDPNNSTMTLNDMNVHINNIYEELKSEIAKSKESRAAIQILYNVLNAEQLEEIKASQDVSNNATLKEYITLAESFRAAKDLNQETKASVPIQPTNVAEGTSSQEVEQTRQSYATVAAQNASTLNSSTSSTQGGRVPD